MLKLTLFEIKRRWKLFAAVFFFYELANLALIFKLKSLMPLSMNMDNELIAFVVILATVPMVLAFVDAVNGLRLEAKQSTRDLYFALPYTSFSKIGSKLFVALVSMLLAGLTSVITVLGTFQYLTGEFAISDALRALSENVADVSFVISYMTVSYTLFIGMIYLSFALFRSFFSQMKFGGAITFALFLGVSYVFEKLGQPFARFNVEQNFIPGTISLWTHGGLSFALQCLSLVVVYGLTCLLFEYKASFD
jgi:hypothetical protein